MFIFPKLKIAGTTLSPFRKQLTSLSIRIIFSLSFSVQSERQISLGNGFGSRLFQPQRKVSPSIFHQLRRPRLSIGFRSLLTFHPFPSSCVPCSSQESNKSRPSGTFIIREDTKAARNGREPSSSSSVKTSRGVANGLVLETSSRIPLPRQRLSGTRGKGGIFRP